MMNKILNIAVVFSVAQEKVEKIFSILFILSKKISRPGL